MAKTKILKKQKKLKTISLKEHIPYNSKHLLNSKLVLDVLFDCLKDNDLETFRDVLISHLKTVNKVSFAKRAKIGRTTLYEILDTDREFNPSLSTIAALMSAISSEKQAA